MNFRSTLKTQFFALLLLVLALMAGLWATRSGINAHMDTYWYMTYAKELRAGQGLTAPITSFTADQLSKTITQWPPFYPLALSAAPDIEGWARIISLVSLIGTTLATYWISLQVVQDKRYAFVAAALFLTIPTVYSDGFSTGGSEGLFIALNITALALMTTYRVKTPNNRRWPAVVAAILVSLGALTRYIGLSVIGALLLYSLWWGFSVKQPRRWLPAVAFGFSLLPLAGYMLNTTQRTGETAGQKFGLLQGKWDQLPESLRQIMLEMLHGLTYIIRQMNLTSNWWALLIAAILLGLIALRLIQIRRQLDRPAFDLIVLLGLITAAYLGFFWATILFSQTVAAEYRHFVFVYPLLCILLVLLLKTARIPLVVIACLLILYVPDGLQAIRASGDGLNYNTGAWRSDPVVRKLPDIVPPHALVHGNDVGYLAFHLDNPARMFGGEAAFRDYTCAALVYPPGYTQAVFTAFNSSLLSRSDLEDYIRNWAAPCGTLRDFRATSFAMVAVVDLNDRVQP